MIMGEKNYTMKNEKFRNVARISTAYYLASSRRQRRDTSYVSLRASEIESYDGLIKNK